MVEGQSDDSGTAADKILTHLRQLQEKKEELQIETQKLRVERSKWVTCPAPVSAPKGSAPVGRPVPLRLVEAQRLAQASDKEAYAEHRRLMKSQQATQDVKRQREQVEREGRQAVQRLEERQRLAERRASEATRGRNACNAHGSRAFSEAEGDISAEMQATDERVRGIRERCEEYVASMRKAVADERARSVADIAEANRSFEQDKSAIESLSQQRDEACKAAIRNAEQRSRAADAAAREARRKCEEQVTQMHADADSHVEKAMADKDSAIIRTNQNLQATQGRCESELTACAQRVDLLLQNCAAAVQKAQDTEARAKEEAQRLRNDCDASVQQCLGMIAKLQREVAQAVKQKQEDLEACQVNTDREVAGVHEETEAFAERDYQNALKDLYSCLTAMVNQEHGTFATTFQEIADAVQAERSAADSAVSRADASVFTIRNEAGEKIGGLKNETATKIQDTAQAREEAERAGMERLRCIQTQIVQYIQGQADTMASTLARVDTPELNILLRVPLVMDE